MLNDGSPVWSRWSSLSFEREYFCQAKGIRVGLAVISCWCIRSKPSSSADFWSGLKPHQAAVAPGAPVPQHTVIRTGQPALAGPQRHLLWVTEVVLHSLGGPIYSVEHAPLGFVMKHWIQELEWDFQVLETLCGSHRVSTFLQTKE